MKKSLFLSLLLTLSFFSFAQESSNIHVGIYHSGVIGQVGIGSNIENKNFGELRFTASELINFPFTIEGYFNRNLKQSEWYNLHAGLMLGYSFDDWIRFGVPLGMTFKPIKEHRQFAILLEATPNYFFDGLNLRANIGVRYSFSN
ncbi:hypothetical protein [Mongoliitalea daihaiensis]|uniref:hypothetical protein n=1 Tax=Mongoliitalea daihaiensis TaxID=2782006 RepID=UPI001F1F3010|nr:hypothetical protein [Mongoliitalea daihaiensis]UJP66418.1 hypothetical protein IPZ59_07400 [Mongoliitalea daihaiensis]